MRIGLLLLLFLSCTRVTHTYEPYAEVGRSDDTIEVVQASKPLFCLGEPFGDVPAKRVVDVPVQVLHPVVGKITKATVVIDTVCLVDTVELPCECLVDTVYVSVPAKGVSGWALLLCAFGSIFAYNIYNANRNK